LPYFQQAESTCNSILAAISNRPEDVNNSTLMHDIETLLAKSYYGYGVIATETNQPKKALKQFEKFLAIARREYDDGLDDSAKHLSIALNEVGVALCMNNRLEEALEYFLDSIKIMQEADDYMPISVTFPKSNLGLAYWMLGKNVDAEDVLLDALKVREQAFGRTEPRSFM
jgi:tetratricopeptide (TPR) repeat protein